MLAASDASIEEYGFDGGLCMSFTHSRDLCGDGSIVIVPPPGNTPGSVIVFGLGYWPMEASACGNQKSSVWARRVFLLTEPPSALCPGHNGAKYARRKSAAIWSWKNEIEKTDGEELQSEGSEVCCEVR